MVATSTTHAEYIAQDYAARELVWILEFLREIGFPASNITKVYGNAEESLTRLYGDNQGALALARNPVHHKNTKHIEVKYHYIREQLAKKVMSLSYCPSQQNMADIMTKPLSRQVFEKHRQAMGMSGIGQ